MQRDEEHRLFDQLAGNRQLRQWLDDATQEQVKILMSNSNPEFLYRAQGAATFIVALTQRLEAANKRKSK